MSEVISRRRMVAVSAAALSGVSGCLDSMVDDDSTDATETKSETAVPDRYEPVLESYRDGMNAYETSREELWERGMEEIDDAMFDAAKETALTGKEKMNAAEEAFEEADQQINRGVGSAVTDAISQALESTEALFNSFAMMESAAVYSRRDEEEMVNDFISGTTRYIERADQTAPMSVEAFETELNE